MKHIVIFTLLISCTQVKAQQAIAYTYDAAGNRHVREAVTQPLSHQAKRINPMEKGAQQQIKIAVDGDQRLLTVEVIAYSGEAPLEVSVHTLDGIKQTAVSSQRPQVSLSLAHLPKGVYIANVRIGDETMSDKFTIK